VAAAGMSAASGRCSRQCAASVARTPRCPSSLEPTAPSTARTASRRSVETATRTRVAVVAAATGT